MTTDPVNVSVTGVATYSLVECERCGPVGVCVEITPQMAAFHHLTTEHGMNVMEEHQ